VPEDKPLTRGRPPATTPQHVGQRALELFILRGFDATTMDDIAEASGIGRRTLFRYFPSKNDMVWGDFDWVLDRLREAFATRTGDEPFMDALREAVIESNRYPPEALPELRMRLTLITTVPALQAHSMLRYAAWRAVVEEFAAARLDREPGDLLVEGVGHAALAASTAAFTHWVRHPEQGLEQLLDRAYRQLAAGFQNGALDI
jgi:mycofactocin system transcriptional regulator